MDIDNTRLEMEFRRQLYLCGGLGLRRMWEILGEHPTVDSLQHWKCQDCGRWCSFAGIGHICGLPKKEK
jgi:hypothetical protein